MQRRFRFLIVFLLQTLLMASAESGGPHELSGVCGGGWQGSAGVGQVLEGAMRRSCQKGWRSVAKVVFLGDTRGYKVLVFL